MIQWTPIHRTHAEMPVTKLPPLGGNDVDLENESSVEEFQAGEYDSSRSTFVIRSPNVAHPDGP